MSLSYEARVEPRHRGGAAAAARRRRRELGMPGYAGRRRPPRGRRREADSTFSSFGVVARPFGMMRHSLANLVTRRARVAHLVRPASRRMVRHGPTPARPTRQPTARAPSSGEWLTACAVPSAGARPIGLRRGCGHQPMLPARVCIGVGYWCGVGRPRASRSGAARLLPAALSRARRGTVRVSPCSKAPGALVGASVNSSDPLETEGGGTRRRTGSHQLAVSDRRGTQPHLL